MNLLKNLSASAMSGSLFLGTVIAGSFAMSACATSRLALAPVEDSLTLKRVVLYRNGIAYFERSGKVEGNRLRLRVRKDQVEDLLKSLTVVDQDGRVVSVSMPLDPSAWSQAALTTFAPGEGSLAEVLDSLRGTEVQVITNARRIRGRIMMVEQIINEPDPDELEHSRWSRNRDEHPESVDHKLTLLSGKHLEVIRLSKVRAFSLREGDVALQLHRRLDAVAGEGMFEQVDVEVALAGDVQAHQVQVSYVVGAPVWKASYRVVLADGDKPGSKALLQGWAVVDNVSGEDWRGVKLSVTAGEPIAFRYDLRTPTRVERPDLSRHGQHRRAEVAVGEVQVDSLEEMEAPPPPPGMHDEDAGPEMSARAWGEAEAESASNERMSANKKDRMRRKKKVGYSASPASVPSDKAGGGYGRAIPAPDGVAKEAAIDREALQQSVAANARTQRVSGLTQIDLQEPVTVPNGGATMVAFLNQEIQAEETYLFRPGGAGRGYERNPYHVLRFVNDSEYVLEPGPIAVYSKGSFVGEGLSESIGSKASSTIPFAVETSITVDREVKVESSEMRLTRIVRGVLEVESFHRNVTTWKVKTTPASDVRKLLIRHAKAGPHYQLQSPSKDVEDLGDAYFLPVAISSGASSAQLEVVEQTPSKIQLTIWDGRAVKLLEQMVAGGQLRATARQKLEPILNLRREIARIDGEIHSLNQRQNQLDRRAQETRNNLHAIKKDKQAANLRARLNQRLEEFTKEGDELGRKVVELNTLRLEKKVALEDLIEGLDLSVL